eukprot:snap_masked-scaffold_14-processed-gene-1.23-mRNA-1 protein AED:0.23 eAED:1.00 QI:0/0/0/1/1/1/2/0/221
MTERLKKLIYMPSKESQRDELLAECDEYLNPGDEIVLLQVPSRQRFFQLLWLELYNIFTRLLSFNTLIFGLVLNILSDPNTSFRRKIEFVVYFPLTLSSLYRNPTSITRAQIIVWIIFYLVGYYIFIFHSEIFEISLTLSTKVAITKKGVLIIRDDYIRTVQFRRWDEIQFSVDYSSDVSLRFCEPNGMHQPALCFVYVSEGSFQRFYTDIQHLQELATTR